MFPEEKGKGHLEGKVKMEAEIGFIPPRLRNILEFSVAGIGEEVAGPY